MNKNVVGIVIVIVAIILFGFFVARNGGTDTPEDTGEEVTEDTGVNLGEGDEETTEEVAEEEAAEEAVVDTAAVLATQEASCVAEGGKWTVVDDHGQMVGVCIPATSDAGSACSDSDDCESWCQAPVGTEVGAEVEGTCYGWVDTDCIQAVEDGMAEAEVCAEGVQ